MKICKEVLDAILNSMPASPPEVGGIIGGKAGEICIWEFDKGYEEKRCCVYRPNVDHLNRIIAIWIDKGYDFITDEDVLNFDNGYGIVGDYYTKKEIIDLNGNVICNHDSSAHLGEYSEGVYFVGYWDGDKRTDGGYYVDTYRGSFYNIEGQIELDISQYSLRNFPYFENGYCYMSMINDYGVCFNAVMDRNGQFLFEPVKTGGSAYISEGLAVMDIKGDQIQIYDLEQKTVNTLENLKEVRAFHDGWATFKTSSDEEGFLDPYGNHLKVKIKIN